MKHTRIFLSVLIYLVVSNAVFSQSKGWTTKPFDQKVFIENKGQFDEKNGKETSKILYGVSREGVEIYFTANGLTYRHDERVPLTEEENESLEKEKPMKSIPHYLSMEWVGSNPDAQIVSEDPVSFYYTYGGEGKTSTTTIKANAFKKIIYKNLYPNIDVEYIFPSDTSGIKYSLILHPGANPSDIKMKYENAESSAIDANGNVVIKSTFGDFIDHAPKTFYKNGTTIKSFFELSGNTVSFRLNDFSTFNIQHSTIIIDPWTTNPTFAGYNKAYDVNYDLNGNVYAYGSYSPFKLIKLNSIGVIQWIYSANGLAPMYGDFTTEASGTNYLVEGGNGLGAEVRKVNPLGLQTGIFQRDTNMREMWRAEYDCRHNKVIIAGGGCTSTTNHLCMIDTSMTIMTTLDVPNTEFSCRDMSMLAIDNNSNFCYTMSPTGYLYESRLIKCPVPGLVPIAFNEPGALKIMELYSIVYGKTFMNGMNGMTVSPNYLYTYDSDSLMRWDKNTGGLVTGVKVSPQPLAYGAIAQQLVSWGGLSADECDNIYVGVINTIQEYNASLSLINTFNLPDTVYDVKLGNNNKLYACGKSFVTQIDVVPNNTSVTIAQTPASSCSACNGIASVSAISCGANPSDFAYTWNTSPVQTTQTATGLCPGNYTVTVSTGCFNSFTGTVTVTGSSSTILISTTSTNANCAANGTATATPSGGVVPYTYNWNNGQTTQTATGLGAGTYTVTVTDANGCSQTHTAIVAGSSSNITVTATTTSANCTANGTATAIPSGGVSPYTYNWNNGQTTQTATGLVAGTYTVTVTDVNGCSQTQTAIVAGSSSNIIITATTTNANCTSNGTATATPSGGATPYSYLWNNGQTTPTATGLAAGTYTVTATDANGCLQTQTVTITGTTLPVVTVNAQPATISTSGGNSQLSATGGGTYSWFPTTGLSCSNCSNPIATPSETTDYCVTVTNTDGCTDSACVTVVVDLCRGFDFTVPNAFSPNNDGHNDLFILQGWGNCVAKFSLIIFDRWGENVFETTDSSKGWDGTYYGKPMNAAVFVYSIKATLISGEKITRKGNISLIR